jgi:hypothetical protein
MSHNIAKINNKYPNNSANIDLKIDNLVGVSQANDGQTIVYNETSNNWDAIDAGAQGIAGYNFSLFGKGESNNYTNGSYTLAVGETWGFYDSSPVNHISDFVTYNYVGSTNWLESITIQPGKYEFFVQTDAVFSSSGYFGIVLKDQNGGYLSNSTLTGNSQTSYGHNTAIMTNITVNQATTVYIKINNLLNVSTNQSTIPSERGVILIRTL